MEKSFLFLEFDSVISTCSFVCFNIFCYRIVYRKSQSNDSAKLYIWIKHISAAAIIQNKNINKWYELTGLNYFSKGFQGDCSTQKATGAEEKSHHNLFFSWLFTWKNVNAVWFYN